MPRTDSRVRVQVSPGNPACIMAGTASPAVGSTSRPPGAVLSIAPEGQMSSLEALRIRPGGDAAQSARGYIDQREAFLARSVSKSVIERYELK